ncbi:GD10915 [Drosophila simulans]|uniref:GD10915 n=1 Tax=Drosophila simulans TaxID=7240 RepID=B4QDG2_DROSI|nr:GD10915 [Drosophila simulans]
MAPRQNEKDCDEDDKEDVLDSMPPPPNYIQISQGRIQLVHQPRTPVESEAGTLPLERHGGSISGSGGCDKFEPLELVNVPFETHRSGVAQIDEGLLVGQMTS